MENNPSNTGIIESTNWQRDAARQFLALADLLMRAKVTFDIVPVIMLHNFYLLTSYLYYKENEIIISDLMYDKICQYMLSNFITFYQAPLWYKEETLKWDRLQAGTGFDLPFPRQILEIAHEVGYLLQSEQVRLEWQSLQAI